MIYYLVLHTPPRIAHLLNVFRYITVRTALASITALLLGLLLGPWMMGRLRKLQIKQFIRKEGPTSHQSKAGTPTMGGILIVAATVIPTLIWADLENPYVQLAIFSMLTFGAIGFADDYTKVVRAPESRPHRPRQTFPADRSELARGPRSAADDGSTASIPHS